MSTNSEIPPDGESVLRHPTLRGGLLHFVYSLLLRELLSLSEASEQALKSLGFDETALSRLRYRNLPQKARDGKEYARCVVEFYLNQPRYCGDIFKAFGGVRVPGLFFNNCMMRLKPFEGRLIVPVLDARAYIVSLQVYTCVNDEQPRWYDSHGLPRGAKALRHPHFVKPSMARESGCVAIAEHTLAADLHAMTNDEPTVAINGLLPEVFARILRESFPEVSLVAFTFPDPEIALLLALDAYGFEVYDG